MDVLNAVADVGWLIAISLFFALWHSPDALTKIARRFIARADGLVASRAAYRAAHRAAMGFKTLSAIVFEDFERKAEERERVNREVAAAAEHALAELQPEVTA